MQAPNPALWGPRILTFLLCALTAGSATFWILQWPSLPSRTTDAVGLAAASPSDNGAALQSLLAGDPQVVALSGVSTPTANLPPLRLAGVIRVGTKGQGSALIQLNGKPAKPYRVGDTIADGLVLQSVSAHTAHLGQTVSSPAALVLELPRKPAQP